MFVLLIFGIILLVIAGVTLWNRRTYSERMNVLRRAVPATTSDIASAFPGEVVSIQGHAMAERPLTSEQSQTPCIYYDFEIVRRYERQRSIASVNRRGRRRSRGRQRGRETVSQNEQWVPFRIVDNTGEIRVNPDGALFEARKVLDRYEREGSNNLFGIPGLDINIGFGGNRTLGYEIRESAIPVETPVFVAGPVSEHGAIDGTGSRHRMIVSYRSGAALEEDWGKRERRQLIGAAIAGGLGALLVFAGGVAFLVSLI